MGPASLVHPAPLSFLPSPARPAQPAHAHAQPTPPTLTDLRADEESDEIEHGALHDEQEGGAETPSETCRVDVHETRLHRAHQRELKTAASVNHK